MKIVSSSKQKLIILSSCPEAERGQWKPRTWTPHAWEGYAVYTATRVLKVHEHASSHSSRTTLQKGTGLAGGCSCHGDGLFGLCEWILCSESLPVTSSLSEVEKGGNDSTWAGSDAVVTPWDLLTPDDVMSWDRTGPDLSSSHLRKVADITFTVKPDKFS